MLLLGQLLSRAGWKSAVVGAELRDLAAPCTRIALCQPERLGLVVPSPPPDAGTTMLVGIVRWEVQGKSDGSRISWSRVVGATRSGSASTSMLECERNISCSRSVGFRTAWHCIDVRKVQLCW